MGAYLSEPITEKVSSDEIGDRVKCGASSMQGWRVSQEDAHNCIIDYDKETSFFAVYDGHGGHEVAQYCSQKLPQFLKECEAYKKGDYVQALKDAFLGFDGTLCTPEVVAVLKEIVKGKGDNESNSASEDEENVKNLYAEAKMPLEQVIAKYRRDTGKKSKDVDEKHQNAEQDKEKIPEASGSGTVCNRVKDSEPDAEVSSSCSQETPGSNKDSNNANGNNIDHSCDIIDSNGEAQASSSEVTVKSAESSDMPDSTDDSKLCKKGKSDDVGEDASDKTEMQIQKEVNGIDSENNEKHDENSLVKSDSVSSSTPVENGNIFETDEKGKKKAVTKTQVKLRKSLRQHAAVALYHSLLGGQDQSDSDSDEADESFRAYDRSKYGFFGSFLYVCKLKIFSMLKFLIPLTVFNYFISSEEEEGGDGVEGDGEEEEEEEGEEEEEEEEDEENLDADDEDDDFGSKINEEPGSDSGCTAVVALLKGQELYVANAGDSRCVVCRNGQAVEMSLDHKPEDECEMERIVKAGGKVTADGRVNGGLNLSRALGDHAYKQSENLSPEEQMITALPDVRTLMIDPKEDEFMVLACDGIWNFMSSQDVVDFVRPRILENPEKLSQICEELFDHCLAPSTVGDGTGCDNMTAVIVQFLPLNKTAKRCLSPKSEGETSKRPKTEE